MRYRFSRYPPGMAKRPSAPEPTVYIQVSLPAELHRSLKVRAAMDDMSLKESVIAAIEEYVA